jgi:DNA (cytosine-5)-methyltransferase 1
VRELHLFAGAGGGILGGMLLGHEPVCAVEIYPYCRQVLAERQADGNLPPFPIFEDVCTFDGKPWRGKVDVVCGGFPCQPWSSAGKRKGTADERHLWPEMARIVGEVRPRYVFAENVALPAFEEPWRDLRRLGYRVPPALCLSAADVGAPHLRKRWWLLASDANGSDLRNEPVIGQKRQGQAESGDDGAARSVSNADCKLRNGSGQQRAQGRVELADCGGEIANASCIRRRKDNGDRMHEESSLEGDRKPSRNGSRVVATSNANSPRLEKRQGKRSDPCKKLQAALGAGWWATEPDIRRVDDGVANRVVRLRALGNGQVPQCAAEAWRILMVQNEAVR